MTADSSVEFTLPYSKTDILISAVVVWVPIMLLFFGIPYVALTTLAYHFGFRIPDLWVNCLLAGSTAASTIATFNIVRNALKRQRERRVAPRKEAVKAIGNHNFALIIYKDGSARIGKSMLAKEQVELTPIDVRLIMNELERFHTNT